MKHRDQILALLKKQIGNEAEVRDIAKTAEEVVQKWVDPVSGGKEEINGLVYGLVQSGKTGVLTVTGAMGADAGYRTIVILTSDNDPLYDQTLGRVQEAFPGIDIIGKNDFKDAEAFIQRIKGGTCAIVATKNSSHLNTLIENFKKGKVRGLSCLLIDDEADQASLNTKARRNDGSQSKINERISDLRAFFEKNTGGCFNPSKGRFLHPTRNRAITMREAALLQSFPKSYSFSLTSGKVAVALMIGNALPPEFIRRQASGIRTALMERALHGG